MMTGKTAVEFLWETYFLAMIFRENTVKSRNLSQTYTIIQLELRCLEEDQKRQINLVMQRFAGALVIKGNKRTQKVSRLERMQEERDIKTRKKRTLNSFLTIRKTHCCLITRMNNWWILTLKFYQFQRRKNWTGVLN